jgi:RNA-directed DNA polymerase
MNVALHGMEQAAGVRYHAAGHRDAGSAALGSPVLIRYADDLLALCHTRQQAEQVKARLAAWLAPRGLAFNEDKTRVVHLDQGVDFLGFNLRRYHGKLLIKPSKAAVKRVRERLAAEMRALRGANAQAVLIRLTPIIRGWSAYYRHVVSSRAFNDLDDYVWKLTYKWAKYRHPHKSKRWITARYFGTFNPSRRDRWVFGDRDSGAYLLKFAWTRIVRHTLVKGWASPTTQSWPTTGRHGNAAAHPHWTGPGCACCWRNAAAARYAGACCCTPTGSYRPLPNGNSGSRPSARRLATRRSPPSGGRPGRTNTPRFT